MREDAIGEQITPNKIATVLKQEKYCLVPTSCHTALTVIFVDFLLTKVSSFHLVITLSHITMSFVCKLQEEQKKREKSLAKQRRYSNTSPRPAWSPANKTIPYGR